VTATQPINIYKLERLQRMRSGERLPAPAVLDISVHASVSSLPEALEKSADTGIVDSVPAAVEQPKPLYGGVDDVRADAGIVDLVPEALEQPKNLPGEEE